LVFGSENVLLDAADEEIITLKVVGQEISIFSPTIPYTSIPIRF